MVKHEHPKALYFLFTVEMWERFSYYGMRALLVLYMIKVLLFTDKEAGHVYGIYTGLVYLTPLIGGYIADRYAGQKNSVLAGAALMMLGHFVLALPGLSFFYIALALLIIGNGFFKPNISTMVGQLYEENDARRDGGFTIFYMGINLGAFFSPLICGTLGEKIGFHYGFASAGIGMLIGLLTFMWGQKRFINEIGNKPVIINKENELLNEPVLVASCHSEDLNQPKNKFHEKRILCVAQNDEINVTKDNKLTKEEKHRIAVIFIMMFFSIFFWASFEQAGCSMTLFADRSTDRVIPFLNIEVPVSWFQSVNPLLIMFFAPLLSKLWLDLADVNKTPSLPIKFAIGMFLISLGFILMVSASGFAETAKVSLFWLVGAYFFHTLGELCISPVGLSMVTKLAPVHFASLLMGIWFLSSFFANLLAGFFAGAYSSLKTSEFFLIPAVITAICAVVLILIKKPVKRWMHGVE